MTQVCFRSQFRAQELTNLCMILTENCVNVAPATAVVDVDYFHRKPYGTGKSYQGAVFMITLRHIVPALCLATGVAGFSAYAASTDPTTATTATTDAPGAHQWRHGHRGGPLGEMGVVLHKLNLSAQEKASIKQVFAEQKSQFEALRASSKSNREALATTPPTDTAAYGALVKTAQANASTRISLMSETWSKIYGALTPPHQQAIPGIVATAQAARESKIATWKAEHGQQ
jgi:Spy/CpxP family protein refolding chaperone